jgi:hypothetical protein
MRTALLIGFASVSSCVAATDDGSNAPYGWTQTEINIFADPGTAVNYFCWGTDFNGNRKIQGGRLQ